LKDRFENDVEVQLISPTPVLHSFYLIQ